MQHKTRSPKFLDEEINLIKDEIDKLLTKGIIKETYHEEKEFVSQCSYLIKVMAESD